MQMQIIFQHDGSPSGFTSNFIDNGKKKLKKFLLVLAFIILYISRSSQIYFQILCNIANMSNRVLFYLPSNPCIIFKI